MLAQPKKYYQQQLSPLVLQEPQAAIHFLVDRVLAFQKVTSIKEGMDLIAERRLSNQQKQSICMLFLRKSQEHPDDLTAKLRLALVLAAFKQTAQSERYFNEIIARVPCPEVYDIWLRTATFTRADQWCEAFEAYQKIAPEDAESLSIIYVRNLFKCDRKKALAKAKGYVDSPDVSYDEILSVATVLTKNNCPAGAVYAFEKAVKKASGKQQRRQGMRRLANALCANNQHTRAYDIYTQILTMFSADAEPRQLLVTVNEAWACAGRVKRQDELGATLAARAAEGKMMPVFFSAVGFATLRKDYGLAKQLVEDLVKEYPCAGTSDFLLTLCQKLPEDKNSPQDRSEFKDAVLNVILPFSGARKGECVALLIKDLEKREQLAEALKLVDQYGPDPRVYAACWRDMALVLKQARGEEKAIAFCKQIGVSEKDLIRLNLAAGK